MWYGKIFSHSLVPKFLHHRILSSRHTHNIQYVCTCVICMREKHQKNIIYNLKYEKNKKKRSFKFGFIFSFMYEKSYHLTRAWHGWKYFFFFFFRKSCLLHSLYLLGVHRIISAASLYECSDVYLDVYTFCIPTSRKT